MNNNKNNLNYSREHHHKLAIKVTLQFIAAIVIFETAYILLNLLFLVIMGAANLDNTAVFIAFKPLMIPLMIVISLIGCGYISYRFIRRPLDYLDDVADAAKKLARPTDAPIQLPDNLKNLQDDLNDVREQTLKSLSTAQKADQKKDDLLIYLAHDLKTPLTSVIGYLTLLHDEPDISPELLSKYTGIARKKAERLEELINEFFEITRFRTSSNHWHLYKQI